MRSAFAIALTLWAGIAVAAGSPAELFGISRQIDFRLATPAAAAAQPLRLEDLLFAPEVAVPAPVQAIVASEPRVYEDLWDRIRDGFAIPELESPLVRRWQSWYLGRPHILKGILDRSRRHLAYVVEEVAKRGLPMELALLPMIESGYDPNAMSPAEAYGLWQFIPSTAREYNLPRGPKFDARADVKVSTKAALDYLEALHGLFHDWQLALAAYNWGEKAVARAIERNSAKGLPTHFLALALPDETRNYLPKLQALKNLISDPGAHHIVLDHIPNRSYLNGVPDDRRPAIEDVYHHEYVPKDEYSSSRSAPSSTAPSELSAVGMAIAPGQAGGLSTTVASDNGVSPVKSRILPGAPTSSPQ